MLFRGEVKRFWEGCQLRIFQRDRRKGWKKGRDADDYFGNNIGWFNPNIKK